MTAIETRNAALRLDIPRKRYMASKGFPTFRKIKGGPVGVWNLFRDGVTTSFLDVWNDNKEEARLAYVEGWTPNSTPLALEYGTCMHWCLEQLYRNWSGTAPDMAEETCHHYVEQYKQVWTSLNRDPSTEAIQQQELVYGFAEITLPNYLKRWDGDFTGKYTHMENPSTHPKKFISLEEEFSVPYVYPDGLTIDLHGKRDLVFAGKDGMERVLDSKCLSMVKDEQIMDMYPTDLQQMTYLLVRFIETGKMPVGSVKNIIRRPGHRRGNKRGVDEPLVDFLARIKTDVSDVRQWDQKSKDTTGWFVRFEMTITEQELLEWKLNTFDPMMLDLRNWFEGKAPHYSVDKHAVTSYGPSRMYAPLIKKDFSRVYKRTRPFPELSFAA